MEDNHGRGARPAAAIGTAVFVLGLSLAGCANDPPKPAPTVTPDQVRSHAEQSFEKLKQEERARENDSTRPH